MICTNGEALTVELSQSLSETVCKDIIKCYHDLIKEAQKEMDGIISSLYADTQS